MCIDGFGDAKSGERSSRAICLKLRKVIAVIVLAAFSAGLGWFVRDVIAKQECTEFRMHIRCCFVDCLESTKTSESIECERMRDLILDLYGRITRWDSGNNNKGEWR